LVCNWDSSSVSRFSSFSSCVFCFLNCSVIYPSVRCLTMLEKGSLEYLQRI
jgi:hypothetical protein